MTTPSVESGSVGTGVAHGKVILIGEHAVVYGHPAIALPVPSLTLTATARLLPFAADAAAGITASGSLSIDGVPTLEGSLGADGSLTLGVPGADHEPGQGRVATVGDPSTGAIYVNLDEDHGEEELAQSALRTILTHVGEKPGRAEVHVEGSIPTARGLGSSAAMSSSIAEAVARLYGHELTHEERFELVQFVERIAHGTPSGLDAYATMADGPIWFHKGHAEPLQVSGPLPLVIADTGIAGRTLEAVSALRELRGREPARVNPAMERIAELSVQTRAALVRGDLATVGAAMNECHEILIDLEISHAKLDELVAAARSAGALGAKLTGGGRGGCMVALAPSVDEVPALMDSLNQAGAHHVWSLTEETV